MDADNDKNERAKIPRFLKYNKQKSELPCE